MYFTSFVCSVFKFKRNSRNSSGRIKAVGSLAGYLGFETVRLIERLPPAPAHHLPVAQLLFFSRFAVFDHLRRLRDSGVPGSRVAAYGRGEDQPIASNLTPDGRAKNRRVEIIIRPIR